MKKEFSVIELACIVREMQAVVGARINKVLQYSDKFIAFECFKSGAGRCFLNVLRPGLFWFGKSKFVSGDFGFHKALGRFVVGGKIVSIVQIGSERIVRVDVRVGEKNFVLYVELFNKGQVVVCGAESKILCLWETQLWKELKIGVQYLLSKKMFDVFAMYEEEFFGSLQVIDETVSKSLAVVLGIGGVYASELCAVSGIDKNKNKLNAEELRVLYANIHYLLDRKIDARIVYDGAVVKDVVPYPLKAYELFRQSSFASYSVAVDEAVSSVETGEQSVKAVSQFEVKKKKLQNIIEVQKIHLSFVERESAAEQRKGELIYENYLHLKELLDKVVLASKKMSFREIKSNAKELGIKDFNDVTGDIVVEV